MRVKKSDLVPLTETELTVLIHASAGRHVHTTFPGGDLVLGEGTRWCLPIIADMRGGPISGALRDSFLMRPTGGR